MEPSAISLLPSTSEDLLAFYEFQLDPEANFMAAFTAKDSFDKSAYMAKYSKFLTDPTIHMCTIRLNEIIVGSISKFVMFEENEITYWIDKSFWGKSIATVALREFLKLELSRPIFGRTAFDNLGSQKVLENNGFKKIGIDKGFANAREQEIEEFIFILE
jgi:RimJ/RimL family protein N-acetyltransferase